MVMRKTADVALIRLSPRHLKEAQESIDKITSTRWFYTYAGKHEKLLVRRRATRRWSQKAADALEASLKKGLPKGSYNITWSWSTGGDEFYFPGTEIMVLFKEGTSQTERKKILRKIKGLKVETYQDMDLHPPTRPKAHRSRRQPIIPGFSKSKRSQARRIFKELYPAMEETRLTERSSKISVPVAKVSIPDSRRDEIFKLTERIKALPKVRTATPDVSVLGKDVLGKPQQADLPPTNSDSVHEMNRVNFAWRLIHPDDLNASDGVFLASRERVAVVDWAFHDHAQINYEWIGYDAADQDQDPRTPQYPGAEPHGLSMSGVIGGQAQETNNQAGIAPGAVVVPIRPTWGSLIDFVASHGIFDAFDAFVERYTTTWIDSIVRLYQLSHLGVEIANMSIAESEHWNIATRDLNEWLIWWLSEGNWGVGVFASAATGDVHTPYTLAIPANVPGVFAVGWGRHDNYTTLGNYGWGVELTVDNGSWPQYNEDGTVLQGSSGTGGTSVMSAVVAATAAIMKSLNPSLSPNDITHILRSTARKVPVSVSPSALVNPIPEVPIEDQYYRFNWGPGGASFEFGYGFLNAHHAAEVAWRKGHPAAEVQRVRYRPTGSGLALIQQRFPPSSPLAGKRMGKFWSLSSYYNSIDQPWTHDRDFRLHDCDQAVDHLGFPYGEFMVVGDYNGDYEHEMALQLHYSEFWPQVCEHPAHSMLAFRFDPEEERWVEMGGRSPYAQGLAAPQIVIPPNQPLWGMFAADLKQDNRDCLVVWGGETISALQYDEVSDTFLRLDPTPFAPEAFSPAVDLATGQGTIIDRRILEAVPIDRGGKMMVFLVSSFTKFGSGVVLSAQPELAAPSPLPVGPDGSIPHLPGVFPPIELPPAGEPGASTSRSMVHTFLTASIIEYDPTTSQWVNWPFSSNPQDTHILLDEDSSAKVETVIIDDFFVPDNNTFQEIVIHLSNDNIHTLHLSSPADTFAISGVYKAALTLDGRVSKLHSGKFGLEGDKAQLAWLSDAEHENAIRFLKWDNDLHTWHDAGTSIIHGRPDNEVIDLTVLRGFNFSNLDGDLDVIALLLEKPDANIYITYRYSDPDGFQPIGIL